MIERDDCELRDGPHWFSAILAIIFFVGLLWGGGLMLAILIRVALR